MNPSFPHIATDKVVGILLAAGRGIRFDPSGIKNKLLQALPNGDTVVSASARKLLDATSNVLAVVRPGTEEVAAQLQALGCEVTVCVDADEGMAASLVHALSRAPDAAGWVIALGDMPFVESATISALVEAVKKGVDIALPLYQGSRGNPVVFGRAHLPALLQLKGDQGARKLLREFSVSEIPVDDPGVLRDVDCRQDIDVLSVSSSGSLQ